MWRIGKLEYAYEGYSIPWYQGWSSAYRDSDRKVDLPAELSIIVDLGKVLDNLLPGSTAYILENDDCRLILLDPLQHPSEGTSRFTIGVNVLLLVVQIRVIDA